MDFVQKLKGRSNKIVRILWFSSSFVAFISSWQTTEKARYCHLLEWSVILCYFPGPVVPTNESVH